MSEQQTERLLEQQRVDRVLPLIRKNMDILSERMSEIKEQVVDIRKHFWNDVTVNMDEPDDIIESHVTLKQQAELLNERERIHRHAQKQYDKLHRLLQIPYFGRIDFRESGSSACETIYLGIGSLLDEKDEQYLVYDWRAPVSSLYYDYGPGPAQYETPSGTISGELTLKRQFIIQHGVIQYMFDTGLTIGDEVLQQVLGQGADAQMRTIVATIQREQNRIIRNDNKRMLIVSGPAGSGKTSAALQRVAYLLYKYRQTLAADQVVLFSPNPMFNRYISTVLPELGEENMEQTTFQEYIEHRLGEKFRLEDPFTRTEYVLTAMKEPGYAARLSSISFKSSALFLQVILHYKETLERSGLVFKPIRLRGRTLISAERIAAKFYETGTVPKLAPRIGILLEWMHEELDKTIEAEKGKPWVKDEVELLDQEDFHKVYTMLRREGRKSPGVFNERQRESELLHDYVLGRHKRRLEARIKRLLFIDIPATYHRLFESPETIARLIEPAHVPQDWTDICALTRDALERKELLYEDATPYLYLQELIEGFQINMNIRHVFIDEAQDYSPFQFEFLKKLFPRCRMTVLGDLNQAIYTHSSLPTFELLNGLFGPDATETIELSRTYRSTRPIVEFTRSLLPDGAGIIPFNRDGERPLAAAAAGVQELNRLVAERLKELAVQPFKTSAVICKTAAESREAYEQLQVLAGLPMHLITQDTAAFETGIVVIPSYLAKGIEFDAVIIYDASADNYGHESERKLFYTACTRAMHRLYLFYQGEMSPFVAAADPNSFDQIVRAAVRK